MISYVAELETQLDKETDKRKRLNTMLELAWELRHGDMPRMVELSQAALATTSGKSSWKKETAKALRNLAYANYRQDDYAQALSQSVEALSKLGGDIETQAGVLRIMGLVHLRFANYAESLEYQLKSREISQELGDTDGQAIAMTNIAMVYSKSGDYVRAAEIYYQVLDLYKTVEHKREQGFLMNNLAYVQQRTGDYEASLASGGESLAIAQELGITFLQCSARDTLGNTCLEMGDDAQALSHFQKSMAIAQAHNYRRLEEEALRLMGTVYIKQQENAKAIACLRKSLVMAQELGIKIELSSCHQLLGRACQQIGDFENALLHHQKFHTLEKEVFNAQADNRLKLLRVTHETEIAQQEAEIARLENVELEKRVEKRTAELAQANAQLRVEIAERKRAEESLSRKTMYLDNILRSATEYAIITTDLDYCITYYNPLAEQFFGHTAAEVIGKTIQEMHTQERVTPERFEKGIANIRAHGEYRYRVVQEGENGTRYLDSRVSGIYDTDSELVGLALFSHNVTGRVRGEETLRRYKQIISATTDHMSFLDRDYIYQAVNEAYLHIHQKARQEIVGHSVADILGADVFEQLVKEKLERCLAGEEVHYQAWFEFPGPGRRYVDVAYYPFFNVDGEITGIVVSSHDITARRQAEEELRASEERFRTVANFTHDWEYWVDPTGNYIYVSPSCQWITGYRADEFARDPELLKRIIHPADQSAFVDHEHAVTEPGKILPLDFRIITRSGAERWIGHICQPVYGDNGRYLGQRGSNRNITVRKQVEEALRESKEQLRQIIDLVPHFIFVKDEIGKFELVNKATAEVFGTTVHDLTGRRDVEFVATDKEMEHFRADDLEVMRSGKIKFIPEEKITDAENNTRYLQTIKVPFKISGSEKAALLGVSVDITERKRTEEALQASEEKYRLLAETMQDVIVRLSPAGQLLYVSPAIKEFGGYDPEIEIGHDMSKYFENETDVTRAAELLAKTLRTRQGGSFEFLFKAKNKAPFPIEYTYIPIVKNDLVTEIQLVMRDISERKRVEAILRQRNSELTMLYQVGQTLTSTLDLDQVIVNLLEEVYRLMRVDACSVWLTDIETGELVCRQAIGHQNEAVHGWRLPPGVGLSGAVVRNGKSLITPDAWADGRYFKGVEERIKLPLRSIITLPLRVRSGVIGVLQVMDRRLGRFDAVDQRLLEPLAVTAAVAIENARLYEQAQQEAKTKALLLRDVNHRVVNNLTMVMSILDTERRRPLDDKADFHAVLDDVANRINGMVNVHRMLSSAQWIPLNLRDVVTEVITAALSGSPIRERIVVTVKAPDRPLRMSSKQTITVALMLNELSTNSIKYAFGNRAQGRIYVRITVSAKGEHKRGEVRLVFGDDGPGMPKEVLAGERHSVGLRLVEANAQSLGGKVELRNDGGAVAIITFTQALLD